MTDPRDISLRMNEVRAEMEQELARLRQEGREVFSLRGQIRKHPGAVATAAGVAMYLLFPWSLLKRRSAPAPAGGAAATGDHQPRGIWHSLIRSLIWSGVTHWAGQLASLTWARAKGPPANSSRSEFADEVSRN